VKIDWETLLMASCAGIMAAGPLAQLDKPAKYAAWAFLVSAASYLKGKYESKPSSGMADKPTDVTVVNKDKDPIPVEVKDA
jgi:hypothetical protein